MLILNHPIIVINFNKSSVQMMFLINVVLLSSKKEAHSGALFINDFSLINLIIISVTKKVITVLNTILMKDKISLA